MKKLMIVTGDIAAGKTTFSHILAKRYGIAAFQKDSIKEVLGNTIGFSDRNENKKLSTVAVSMLYYIFGAMSESGSSFIVEANFHTEEQKKLISLAQTYQYAVLTLVLRGNADILYERYVHRMNEENRHPVHLSTTMHVKEDFMKVADFIRNETYEGDSIVIDATDFSYQTDEDLLKRLDSFMQ